MTARISLDRFLYMEANLSMKRQLEREHVSPDILRLYEEHRWLNYIGQWALYYYNKECFNATERKEILERLRTCYATFSGQPHRLKLGYVRPGKTLFHVALHQGKVQTLILSRHLYKVIVTAHIDDGLSLHLIHLLRMKHQ